jgi:hypothetical protein
MKQKPNGHPILIHLEWSGPHSWDKIPCEPQSRGIYQVYGGHPVYGGSALLYIGQTCEQTFAARIKPERWLCNRDFQDMRIYLGQLINDGGPRNRVRFERLIDFAERLLIYAHSPCLNTQKNLAGLEPELRHVHVLNWGSHKDLLPEVSGARWTGRFDQLPSNPWS